MAITFNEQTPKSGTSGAHFGSAWHAGGGEVTYVMDGLTVQDLLDLPATCVGNLLLNDAGAPVKDNYGLQRILPRSFPIYPWWLCSSIKSIEGIGTYTKTDPQTFPNQGWLPAGQFNLYETYLVTLEFTPALFDNILSDAQTLPVIGLPNQFQPTWFTDNGTEAKYNFAPEWLRNTHWEIDPQFQAIAADKPGGMIIQSNFTVGSLDANGQVVQVNMRGKPFQGKPFLYLPDQLIKFTWYQVPVTYFTSPKSYITRFVGRVNQNNWYNWQAGQLLYIGYKPTIYKPPVKNFNIIPQAFPSVDARGKLLTPPNPELVMDVEFHFLLTNRFDPNAIHDINVLPLRNFVPAGHNCLPCQDFKFHYVTNPDGVPPWLSFPFPLLFTNPDTLQPQVF